MAETTQFPTVETRPRLLYPSKASVIVPDPNYNNGISNIGVWCLVVCGEYGLQKRSYHWQAFYCSPSGMSLLAKRIERPTNKPELLHVHTYVILGDLWHYLHVNVYVSIIFDGLC